MDLSDKSILVLDRGIFFSFAQRMAEGKNHFGTVYYHNPANIGNPSINEDSVGRGFENIVHVKQPDKLLKQVDVIAFPYCEDPTKQGELRADGYPVWGSGVGCHMETDRLFGKKLMAEVGLPVSEFKVVKGLDRLKGFMEEHPDWIVKISHFRGLTETWKLIKPWMLNTKISELAYKMGPRGKDFEFIVEKPIETKAECGYSGLFYAGRFPSLALMDAEIKDAAYMAVVQPYDRLPDRIHEVNDRLFPALKTCKYANSFATELRDEFCIDLTCRFGSPSGEAQMALWENLPEVVYWGARGKFIEPVPAAKYAAQIMIETFGDLKDWKPVYVPKEIQPFVRLYFPFKDGDEIYIVPQWNPFSSIGTIVATGETWQEANALCRKRAKMLDATFIHPWVDGLAQAEKEWAEMEKRGMDLKPY